MRTSSLCLLLLLAPGPALAQAAGDDAMPSTRGTAVAVLPLELPSELEAQRAKLDAAVAAEIHECNLYKVLAGHELQASFGARGRGELAACRQGTCLNEMLEVLQVQRVVSSRVKEVGSGYTVTVELIGGPPGENRSELHWTGEPEEMEQVVRAATQLAAVPSSWHEAAGIRLPELPKGATVYVDGRQYDPGDTGTVGPLALGTHELLVEHPDYQEWKQPIVLGSGQLLEMKSRLEETRIYHEWWFWTAIVGAAVVAAVVPTAVLLSDDGGKAHTVPTGDLGKVQLGVVRW